MKSPNDFTKSLCEWASRMIASATNASSWIATSATITWATRRSGRSDRAPTMSSIPTQIAAIAPLPVTWLAPAAIHELENASPSVVSVNGMKSAVNCALAARMYVNATAMPMPTMAPTTGEMTRET